MAEHGKVLEAGHSCPQAILAQGPLPTETFSRLHCAPASPPPLGVNSTCTPSEGPPYLPTSSPLPLTAMAVGTQLA